MKLFRIFWDFTPLWCDSALVLICVEAQHSDQVLCWRKGLRFKHSHACRSVNYTFLSFITDKTSTN